MPLFEAEMYCTEASLQRAGMAAKSESIIWKAYIGPLQDGLTL
jgi:hypothetical protein